MITIDDGIVLSGLAGLVTLLGWNLPRFGCFVKLESSQTPWTYKTDGKFTLTLLTVFLIKIGMRDSLHVSRCGL